MDQYSANYKGSTQQVLHQHHEEKTTSHSHYACLSSYLVSDPYTIILMITLTHVSSLQHKITFTVKNSTRKIGDWYQAYCTTYRTHAKATCHRGKRDLLNRGLDILAENTEHANINSDSTYTLDATVALGDQEAVDHPEDPVYKKPREAHSPHKRDK